MAQLSIKAPLAGIIVPLDKVPDPVFSQKMVGEGIAIDPLATTLTAPCDGTVTQLHRATHAVTIASDGGVEVLMHIGLETVTLKGEGFTAKVKEGDRVKTGDALIEFDADHLARNAKSLLTEIVIASGESITADAAADSLVEAGTPLITVTAEGASGQQEAAASTADGGDTISSDPIAIINETGLHARPAAVLVSTAKKFNAEVRLTKGDKTIPLTSPIKILTLAIDCGDKVTVSARGSDAAAAVQTLSDLLATGVNEGGAVAKPAATAAAPAPALAPPPPKVSDDPNLFLGVCSSPGLSVGAIFHKQRTNIPVDEKGGNPADEKSALEDAIKTTDGRIRGTITRLNAEKKDTRAAIFAAHLELLADPELKTMAEKYIDQGKSAPWAWKTSYRACAEELAALPNPLLAARAADLLDVGMQVLAVLTGYPLKAPEIPENAILVATEFAPSDTAGFDPEKIAGFCTLGSGATSHVAIIARSLGIPSVAGIDERIFDVADGTTAILDGSAGTVRINPDDAEVERIRGLREKAAAAEREYRKHAHEPATTTDGHRIEIMANITSIEEAGRTIELGGDGVGLMRSEFLFLDRSAAPDENEQQQSYIAVLNELQGRPAIIRTLDVGGDKPLTYLPIEPEENPFLGIRGIRAQLAFPELLRTQIRALVAAAETAAKEAPLRIMIPMVSNLTELRTVRAILDEEKSAQANVELGIMVEVPATAVMAEQFAREVDFFSIGTNDLTQYTLAVDRGHPRLAGHQDALNPAILQLIANTVKAGHKHDCMVGICGGVAGDPQAVPILIGLGLDELSISLPVIPAVKAQVRTCSLKECQALAEKALTLGSAEEVRALVKIEE